MNKSVLISIQPKWCEKIASGEKTVEVRKTKPKIETPFKCYVYCTEPNTKNPWKLLEIHSSDGKIHKGNGKVVGEFVCDEIYDMRDVLIEPTCLTIEEWCKYTDNHKGIVYGWHISDLKIYDEPRELSEFRTICKYGDDYPCQICNKSKYDDCNILYCDNILKRPPQSWCYVTQSRYSQDEEEI